MKYDDETLMAYADGELDEATRAGIATAMKYDAELARRVAEHRAVRAEIVAAYSGVMDQPVPDRLRAAARGPADPGESPATPAPRGNVVHFPARGSRAPGAPWTAREWTAMAASLVLGGLIAWQFLAGGMGEIATQGGALVARGELAKALDSQLASDQPEDAAVRIGLSFRTRAGGYCRSFVSRSAATAGLACRSGDGWTIPVTTSAAEESGGLRQANSPAIMQAIEQRMAGDALDAADEKTARDSGWK